MGRLKEDDNYFNKVLSRQEHETSCSCLKILQLLCQATQIFLFLHMMKIRDLKLSKNLERHHLSCWNGRFCSNCCIWIIQTEEQGKYQNVYSPDPHACGSPRLCCDSNDSMTQWPISCIKNSGQNLNLKRGMLSWSWWWWRLLSQTPHIEVNVYVKINCLGQTRTW